MKIFLLYFQFFLFSIYIFSQSPRVAVTSVTSGNISNTFWNSYQEDIHDQIEFSSNIIYKWDNFITTSAGIYLTDRNYFVVYSSYYENSAVFQSLGAIINLPGFNIEIALADSHLFSDELRKQTLVKLGLNLLM